MIVFYDGNCPLCVGEMNELKRFDQHNKIDLVNIHDNRFSTEFPEIEHEAAMAKLHGYDSQGKLILGLDVTAAAWGQVGKHRWIKLLRLPIIRTIADGVYLFFARHRMKISKLLAPNQCSIQNSGDCNRD
ncbi:thiol-disulfide oxidoreductase DCC family protein [Pseudoalteromonas piscicida]|uniref:thiol-disulfide oxidoreductase DCC family protein n=1 Tax=Pseudoalteromonas piscicida TaxID=43662 RepID=UPI001C98D3B3|nr:DUF393 domain-containing protein [Pseudoalteromonas piscicida]QZO15612.1 DUF393 domain-containing protein [Pseudoalteromonas piscicida]